MRDRFNKDHIKKVFAAGVVRAFSPRAFRLYASHRWTGYEEVLDQQGLLQACHGLAARVAMRFLNLGGQSVSASRSSKPSLGILDRRRRHSAPCTLR